MKKILFVASTLNAGGAQKVLSNLLMNLPDEYEADILLNDIENIVYPYKGNLISLGFKPQADMLSLFFQMKVFVRRVRVLHKLKATGEYIATVSFLDSANIANIISGKRKCRTILSVHNNLTESASEWVYKYLVNPMVHMLYRRADAVIAVSKGIVYDLINNLKLSDKNIVMIYNGHDIAGIKKMAEQSVSEEFVNLGDGPIISTMGRMNYQKGQWHLVRALKEVKKEFPDIRLLLLGEGELHTYLKQLVHECELDDNVVFCGFLENPFKIIARSSIFVLPSMFEGFPNALIEALSCGVPCVATDFRSGAREILAPNLPVNEQFYSEMQEVEYGILTPVCDGKLYDGKELLTEEEHLLAKAIIKLIQNKDLQQQYKENMENAIKDLDVKNMTQKWLEVIEG